jgi:SH3-like domain-containing protein
MRLLILLLFSVLMAFGIHAQTVTRCEEVRAYVVNPRPGDLRVRTGAGNSYAAVGRLPDNKLDTVNIIASSGGWIKINRAEDEDENVFFKKVGWIPVAPFGLTTASNPATGYHYLYAGPSKKSRTMDRLKPDTSLMLLGCSGKWIKVKVHRKIGWLAPEAQCSNSKTTCV